MHMVSSSAAKLPSQPESLKAIQVWTEQGEGQQRRISAIVEIPHPIAQVWQVLTDYEQMPDFIPNLITTQRIEHPSGGIRIEQIGYCRVLKLRITARVVLDMTEHFPHHISFQMVEGDFQKFSGFCQLESQADSQGERTALRYSIQVLPKFTMPVAILERQLRHDLPMNLLAIRQRVTALFGSDRSIS